MSGRNFSGKQSGNAEAQPAESEMPSSLRVLLKGRADKDEGFFCICRSRSLTGKPQIQTEKRRKTMNTLTIVLIAAVVLACAYVFYGRWLANKWGIDPKAKTPAVELNDGKDFVFAGSPEGESQ